ncbi:unnamed protein product [Soboliphyme baturini]|uniref:CRAL-TRIO domain-containing protein n=1 Tax=Soboliphyme baturini TaxID=241478 RepID=A0A183JAF0_9BILA|nr:unnamed protein product [Soboliphyme baturini]
MYRLSWTVFGDNYVEWMRHCLIINAPWFFSKLWNIFGVALPQLTRLKIKFLDSDWKEQLLDYVDPDLLPKYWGGNLVDENGDERCASKIQYPLAEKIPTNLYWKFQLPNDYFADHQTLNVAAGATLNLVYQVKQANVTIKWNTYSDDDYGFELLFSEDVEDTSTDSMDICFPYFVYPGKIAPADEVITNAAKGVYYFGFTNKAWFFSVAIQYRIEFENGDTGQPADVLQLA